MLYFMLCYAMQIYFFFIYTYTSPGMRLNTYAIIPQLVEYIEPPYSHERSNATSKCTSDLPSCNRAAFQPQNAKKSAVHSANELGNRLASTVRYGQSRLQVAINIHQTPFVFPFFACLIETLFPWFIKGFEPAIIASH